MNVQNHSMINGRALYMFSHPSKAEWGYEKVQYDSFAIIFPKDYDETKKYPLDVVFHSAGHDVYSTLGCIWCEGNHDIYHVPDNMFGLVLDCRANTVREDNTDWWWGGNHAHREETTVKSGVETQPVEKRCMATIQWVCENYGIDTNRIYAVGNSMGGSGALGVALNRGDVFAAIKVNVPAGARHAMDRCCMDSNKPEGFKIPDPPIVVDYSAQNDLWSYGHDQFYKLMCEHKYAVMGFWGPFGHENNNKKIKDHNDLIHSFDAFSVKLNEAYPVFTNASTDDEIPWPDNLESDKSGQINAFFRWRVITDSTDCFEIELRLLKQDEWESRVEFPKSSTADVSLRRLQKFTLNAGDKVTYSFGDKCGECVLDNSLLTVKNLTVTDTPKVLKIKKA